MRLRFRIHSLDDRIAFRIAEFKARDPRGILEHCRIYRVCPRGVHLRPQRARQQRCAEAELCKANHELAAVLHVRRDCRSIGHGQIGGGCQPPERLSR